MHWLSIILGLIFAWAILSFIGPRKTVSYYTQAPIRVENLSGLDGLMEAVGLQPSMPCAMTNTNEVSMSPSPPLPPPPQSVADAASPAPPDFTNQVASPAPQSVMPPPQSEAPSDQDISPTPQPFEPAASPSPVAV